MCMSTHQQIKDEPNIFHAVMVPQTLQPYILYESHNAIEHNEVHSMSPVDIQDMILHIYYNVGTIFSNNNASL